MTNGIMLMIDGNQTYCEQHNMLLKQGDVMVVPFVINLSSDRWEGILAFLGLDLSEYSGQCWGRVILNVFDTVVNQTEQVGAEEYGMSDNDLAFYLIRLVSMCEESLAREERIIWS